MKNLRIVFSLFVIVLLSACNKDTGFYEDDYGDPYTEESDNGNNFAYEGEEGSLTLYRINGNDIDKIKDFKVRNKYKSYQQDYQRHLDMWNYFVQLIPNEYRGRIVEFEVFHGEGELLGYVAPIDENDLSKWRMGLAIDVDVDLQAVKLQSDFAYTSIHEFAHVETLNESQVKANANSCGSYHTGEGCAIPNAYINRLYEIGWKDIYKEYENIDPDDYDAMDTFYRKYQDRFVSDYAATNPGEDIAEVFTYFVVEDGKRTGNTIADKKVNMLYDFPELVEIRKSIRKNPVVRAMQPGSWTKYVHGTQLKKRVKMCDRHSH